jgi:propionyl-CoA carboxylase beta chain
MNARDLGADYAFAWPDAQIGVMGARQAVGVVHRRDIEAAEDPDAARTAYADAYAEAHLGAALAAAEGYVDDVVAPAHTRGRLIEALASLEATGASGRGTNNFPL